MALIVCLLLLGMLLGAPLNRAFRKVAQAINHFLLISLLLLTGLLLVAAAGQ